MKNSLTEKWIVCRICLKKPKEPMRQIFDENDDEKDLTQKILECGGVPIRKFDHYPDKICVKCLKYLQVAYKFRVTCQGSYKQLSKLIAPVIVDKVDEMTDAVLTSIAPEDITEMTEITPEIALELDEAEVEDISFKLEPEDIGVKEEISEIDEGEILDVYQPMDEEDNDAFNYETVEENIMTAVSDNEIEFLEDEEEESEVATSDEEFLPIPKLMQKKYAKNKMKRAKKGLIMKPSTSRRAALMRTEKPGKRGPKPKKHKETSFICDICGNIYPSQGRLTEHIKLHKGIKPHECEICGHAFAQTQQLARHMNTHTGNRPYKCTYCPAAFADLSTRNKHHRIHTNERPYVCDVCGKAFTYTNTLKFHKMIHTGEKPHVCDVCGKGFQQAYKLRNHKLTHDRKVGVKLEKIEVEALNNYEEQLVCILET